MTRQKIAATHEVCVGLGTHLLLCGPADHGSVKTVGRKWSEEGMREVGRAMWLAGGMTVDCGRATLSDGKGGNWECRRGRKWGCRRRRRLAARREGSCPELPLSVRR